MPPAPSGPWQEKQPSAAASRWPRTAGVSSSERARARARGYRSPALSTSATASAIQAIARGTFRRFRTRTSPGTMRPGRGRRSGSVNDVEGRDIVAVGVLVVQAGDRFLRRVGRVVGAEEDAVLLDRRIGPEEEGLV